MSNPTLLCLTGLCGSGKSMVKDLFSQYTDTEVCDNLDLMSKFKPTKKLVVFDSIKSHDEFLYLKWLANYSNIMIITVECPIEERIKRVKARDNCSDIAFQLKDKPNKVDIYNLQSLSNYIIHNGRSIQETSHQVYYIHSLLTEKQNLLYQQNTR